MSNEVANLHDSLPSTPGEDQAFDDLVKSEYPPRLQLVASNSKIAMDPDNGIPGGILAVVDGDKITDRGKEVTIVPLKMRPMALRIKDSKAASFYDPESEEFKEIQHTAKTVKGNTGCMFGPVYLCYLPGVGRLVTLFCGTATLRRDAKHIQAAYKAKEACTLRVDGRTNGTNNWLGLKVQTAPAPPFDMEQDKVVEQVEQFLALKSAVQAEDGAPAEGRAR